VVVGLVIYTATSRGAADGGQAIGASWTLYRVVTAGVVAAVVGALVGVGLAYVSGAALMARQ
jgi:hypothetical protein